MDNDEKVRVPVQQRSRQTRQRILQAGRELFARAGYRETSVKQVAQLAGSATGSVYAYFPDKPSLFLEIVEHYYREIFACIQSGLDRFSLTSPPQDPREIRRMLAALLQTLSQAHDIDPELHREISLMLLASTNHDDTAGPDAALYRSIRERVHELDQEVENWITQLIRRLRPELPADTMAPLVFRVCEETIHRLKQFPESLPPEAELLGQLEQMISCYLFSGENKKNYIFPPSYNT